MLLIMATHRSANVFLSSSKKGIPLPFQPTPTHGPKTKSRHRSVFDTTELAMSYLRIEHVAEIIQGEWYSFFWVISCLQNMHAPNVFSFVHDALLAMKTNPPILHFQSILTSQRELCTGKPQRRSLKRRFTIREFARLQGFPDGQDFPSNRRMALKQIYIAVPVKTAFALGKFYHGSM